MPSDDQLVQMLRLIERGDQTDQLADNAILAEQLKWTLAEVAACLQTAKDRSLIWGHRSGEKPAPWFTDLEVTVQGRRLLAPPPSPR